MKACVKCTSTGRKCDGYSEPNRAGREAAPKIMMIVTDLERAACDQSTGYALRFFYEASAPGLTNYSSNQFWSRVVLQACLVEPCIRDLAIAAASLERSVRDTSVQDSSIDEHSFMMHYGRALKELSNHKDIGVILIGCLLLVLCEDLQDNPYGAMIHINAGRRLLSQHADRIDQQLLTDLGAIFRSLVIHSPELATEIIRIQQLVNKGTRFSSRLPYLSGSRELSSGFRSVQEAADTLLDLRPCTIQARQYPRPLTRFHSVPGITLKLNDWLERFNYFTYFLNEQDQASMKVVIHSLRVYHLMLEISSRCPSSDEETAYDVYANNLEGLAKRLSILSELGATHVQSILFFVACKYRDVADRRRCINLLRYQSYGPEGHLLADVAEKIAEMEELGLHRPVTCEDIPNTSRVRPHKIARENQLTHERILIVSFFQNNGESTERSIPLPPRTIVDQAAHDLEWENRTLQRAIDLYMTVPI